MPLSRVVGSPDLPRCHALFVIRHFHDAVIIIDMLFRLIRHDATTYARTLMLLLLRAIHIFAALLPYFFATLPLATYATRYADAADIAACRYYY